MFSQLKWRALSSYPKGLLPPYLFPWLSLTTSMTRALREHTRKPITFQITHQGRQHAKTREANTLDIPCGAPVFVREGFLCVDGQPYLFAQTIVPALQNSRALKIVMHADSKPIGDRLFSAKKTIRTPIHIAQMNHASLERTEPCWARRSMILFEKTPVLVTELFLAEFK